MKKTARLLLCAMVAVSAATVAVPPAHAIINCDDGNEHDIEVRYQDKCVLADVPYIPPIITL